ncbi:hypothetical protein [Cellulomonas avistercoris]|nr:hypothetical protein [Cellulomonas avistercoris]
MFPAVPDPIDSELQPMSMPPELEVLPEGGKVVGVVGHITRRKNLDLIARALCLTPSVTALVVGGKFEPGELERCQESLAQLSDSGTTVHIVDRSLEDSELAWLIERTAVVVVAHSSEGPSGILGMCAAIGTPVAAAGARSLRGDVRRLRCGTWSRLDELSLAEGIQAAERMRPTPALLAGSADFARAMLALDDAPGGVRP